MNKKTSIIAALALIIGFGGGFIVAGREPGVGSHLMPSGLIMDDSGMRMDSAMEGMMDDLKGRTGDDFDKAFLFDMIVHHQGAVRMAEAALESANHAEIKDMAHAIITAQTAEIAQMKEWRKTWYGIAQ